VAPGRAEVIGGAIQREGCVRDAQDLQQKSPREIKSQAGEHTI
jgi:hypothetical protein